MTSCPSDVALSITDSNSVTFVRGHPMKPFRGLGLALVIIGLLACGLPGPAPSQPS